MKKRDRCSSSQPETGCHSIEDIQTVQPFPSDGLLAKNLGLPLPDLAYRVGQIHSRAYSYVVRTVKLKQEATTFEQHGSAPNFQGDVLTLCTCKHQMRSRQSADQWQDDVWIAGFTSRTIYDRKHWLFYLAKVKLAHDSHTDLWSSMDADSRNSKAAHVHYLGDMFKPKTPIPTGDAQFSPARYVSPTLHAHRWRDDEGWHNGWHNDISYHLTSKLRNPPLLVADPMLTFLWDEPMIYLAKRKHCRDYCKWPSLQDLIAQLREAAR
ncbi:MAG: hypothetical protein ACKV2Q_13310 [Planctomycetaceae bacterium]